MNQFLTDNWLLLVAIFAVIGGVFAAGIWYSSVNQDRIYFREFMAEIRSDIKNILSRLPPKVISGASPMELTDMGRDVSLRLNASALAKDMAAILTERASRKSPFEIQEISFSYIHNEYVPSSDMDESIKACAFDNGISRKDVLDVLAVELRDILLREVAS